LSTQRLTTQPAHVPVPEAHEPPTRAASRQQQREATYLEANEMAIETDGAMELRASEGRELEAQPGRIDPPLRDIAACRRALNAAVKRQLDLLGALVLAIVFSPLMLVI